LTLSTSRETGLVPEAQVVAVRWLGAQQLEHDEVERALQERGGFRGHGRVKAVY